MQSEQTKDWHNSDGWIPNYNSAHYINRLRALNASLNSLLESGSFNGVRYRDVINDIDIRGYGNYGEWHNGGLIDYVSEIPAGAHATTATLKAIIDAHTQTIPNFQLTLIMTAFDYFLQHTMTSPEVGYYALTTSNAYGKLGWRRDNWGAGDGTGDSYIDDLLMDNTGTFNGVQLKTLITEVWKYAPVGGEPMNDTSNNFADLENQIRKYHATMFGNGNIATNPDSTRKARFRAASKAAGYRINLLSAEPLMTSARTVNVKTAWQNVGIAPIYDKRWEIAYQLVNSAGTVVQSTPATGALSTLRLLRADQGVKNINDSFDAAFGVANGVYSVRVVVRDKTEYMSNLSIASAGGNADKSFTLGTVTIGTAVPPANLPPTVTASDVTIKLPATVATLTAVGSDPEQGALSYTWSKVSGLGTISTTSNSAVANVTGLTTAGTSVFKVTVTDIAGATASKDVTVITQAADVVTCPECPACPPPTVCPPVVTCPPPVTCPPAPPQRNVTDVKETMTTSSLNNTKTYTFEVTLSDGTKQTITKTV